MSAVYTLGAGSDARTRALEALVVAPGVPIVYLLVLRVLQSDEAVARRGARQLSSSTPVSARSENPHSQIAAIDEAPATNAVATIPTSGTVTSEKLGVPAIGAAS